MKKIIPLLTCILLILPFFASPGFGAELSTEEVARRLQQSYEKMTTMSARFQQTTSVRMSPRVKKGSGTLIISKPGRMRWDYQEPAPQVLVSDGKTVTMYFKQSNQMTVTSAEEYLQSDVTYSFFTGKGNILRDFEVMAAPPDVPTEPGTYAIELVPRKPHPQVEKLRLWVDRDRFLITRLQVIDQFGSVTDLRFSDIKTGVAAPAGLFTFTPPPGTEIIRQ
ncbi:MAG: outer membrane lipoprotein carrier protein LolA [Desulfobacteraceae bacterium]|nr:outer membrane lipoprotein carrier protein LolA [Desulfobacteraceae bacterium]